MYKNNDYKNCIEFRKKRQKKRTGTKLRKHKKTN